MIEIFKETYKLEGIYGFYRGYTVSLIGALPYAGSAYFVYETLKIFHRSKWILQIKLLKKFYRLT